MLRVLQCEQHEDPRRRRNRRDMDQNVCGWQGGRPGDLWDVVCWGVSDQHVESDAKPALGLSVALDEFLASEAQMAESLL